MAGIGWFTTARGPGSLGLLTALESELKNGLDAELSFVFINRAVKGNEYRIKLISKAEALGADVIILPSDGFEPELKKRDMAAWRDAYGAELRRSLGGRSMDFGVLAGFMLVIDPATCAEYPLINLHPALPGTYAGTWEEIVAKVVDNGDEEYGSMVHIVSSELDRGAALTYDSFRTAPLRAPGLSREELMRRIRAEESSRETGLLMRTIRMLASGELRISNGQALKRDGSRLERPIRVDP